MIEIIANHEQVYISNRKKGKRLKYASPLDVYAWKIKIREDTFEIWNEKNISLRKNGTYIPLSKPFYKHKNL